MDIGIVWDPVQCTGDWASSAQSASSGGDLTAAVLVSLFTDRRLPAGTTPPDGTTDLGGCWTDSYDTQPIGSYLWLLVRARRSQDTLNAAQGYVVQALEWLLQDDVVTAVNVVTFWAGRWALGIRITLTLPSGQNATLETFIPFSAVS